MIFASILEEPSDTPNCTSFSLKCSSPFCFLHSAMCSFESFARSSSVHLGPSERVKRESTSAIGMEILQKSHWNTIRSTAFCGWVYEYMVLPPEMLLLVSPCTEKPPKVPIGVINASLREKIGWLIRRSNWARRMAWWLVYLMTSNWAGGSTSKFSCLNIASLTLITADGFWNKLFSAIANGKSEMTVLACLELNGLAITVADCISGWDNANCCTIKALQVLVDTLKRGLV